MKILWIVNTIFPFPAKKIGIKQSSFGGWLNGLADQIKKNDSINLAIYNGKKILEFEDEKIKYYLIPGAPAIKYSKKIEEYWKEVNKKFQPDLVHIHGTEYTHGLAYVNAKLNKKIVISIQGLLHRYSDIYLGNISNKKIIKNITFRDIIKFDNLFQQKNKFQKRGKYEISLINKSRYIIGRTTWDYANIKAINPNSEYFVGNETLRKGFYKNSWNIEKIDRHTLFCSQAGYPIKGLHYLIEAIAILKIKYEDIKLYVGGTNILENSCKGKL